MNEDEIIAKFHEFADPVLGQKRAKALGMRFWGWMVTARTCRFDAASLRFSMIVNGEICRCLRFETLVITTPVTHVRPP